MTYAPTETAELDLWNEYKAARAAADQRRLRDQLILLYSPLVKYVAGRVASGLPNSVDSADLVSYGVFGLIDAIEKFDPERGHKFETYAMSRIRGAIVDELRSLDWVPRTLRAKAREIEKAYQRLEGTLHRTPTDGELAREVGMTLRQLQNVLGRLATTGVTTLEGALAAERGDVSRGDALADRRDGPGDNLMAQESRSTLMREVALLPERERNVLTLYYFEGLNMSEIGEVLTVSESRVCQIHAKAVLHLRSRLAAADLD
jgi:RNA polymerase sigma factor for flagellar operon FliA